MGRALDRPEVAEAYNKALDAEKAGDIDVAVAAYHAYLELDPEDYGGAVVRLAALGRAESPQRAPDSYVETLFDQHAQVFESILVQSLGYEVPALMRQRLDALGLGSFARMLDLGCGTGLAAEAMAGQAECVIGLDLSSRMLDVCEEKDIYDGLYCAEAAEFLGDNEEAAFDLISACDVLPYVGDVSALCTGVANNLNAGGILVLSFESMDDAGRTGAGYEVNPHQRFTHWPDYVVAQTQEAGFEMLSIEPINVRMQNDAPTPGHLLVVRKI